MDIKITYKIGICAYVQVSPKFSILHKRGILRSFLLMSGRKTDHYN